MKNLIIKTNPVILILIFIAPTIFNRIFDLNYQNILFYLQYTFLIIWTISILDYLKYKIGNFTKNRFINFILILDFLIISIAFFANKENSLLNEKEMKIIMMSLLSFAFITRIYIAYFLTKRTEQIFFNRSKWFMFLEYLIPFLGIYTISREINLNEK